MTGSIINRPPSTIEIQKSKYNNKQEGNEPLQFFGMKCDQVRN